MDPSRSKTGKTPSTSNDVPERRNGKRKKRNRPSCIDSLLFVYMPTLNVKEYIRWIRNVHNVFIVHGLGSRPYGRIITNNVQLSQYI